MASSSEPVGAPSTEKSLSSVYTPLLSPARQTTLPLNQLNDITPVEVHHDSQVQNACGNPSKEKGRKSSATSINSMKKSLSKSSSVQIGSGRKCQRSIVRPFFCCGSELSLVSLVDGIELKDFNMKNKTSIECETSDEEEQSQAVASPFRKTVASSRKKKDKKRKKKRFWNIPLRRSWNSRLHVSRSQQKCVVPHLDLAHADVSMSYQVNGSPNITQSAPLRLNLVSPIQYSPSEFSHTLRRFYPVTSSYEEHMRERAREMALGIEIDPAVFSRAVRPNLGVSGSMLDILRRRSRLSSSDSAHSPESPVEDYSDILMSSLMRQRHGAHNSAPRVHTQIDFIHCLVPDLTRITSCSFYWGIMDRYEAERLLDNKPEGTFLLRDSAQEDFLFSVSFRRYNRSLHARVEQWNHQFSFDAHDPAVFSAGTICDLMEHYKDSSCCLFFEPMLTRPLHRSFPFSLQHFCRSKICDQLRYDDIRALPLPNSLKQYLQVYHYKQKVCVRTFDEMGQVST